ncbi:hypothetical protein SAMN06264364_10675 [Quadrisphaera granulorum]|uniref:Uncharacterized protein n=1 Tax=Quadrisphaera granulorum TaxID=317664 RepID=A0A316AAP7_9ACTN|nr:hypothetical protein BXY45_10675 [Quadrisphaera granulorum]SZE95994.1 hypothetical protein SAMN06264364_10675 [Quadrisphaera granulorum]
MRAGAPTVTQLPAEDGHLRTTVTGAPMAGWVLWDRLTEIPLRVDAALRLAIF